jgi:hypothetical protein
MVTPRLPARMVVALPFFFCTARPLPAQDCAREFDNTYDLIQAAIFEQHDCTNDLCHGSAVSGGLDLRAGASYEGLIDQPSPMELGWLRVIPGQKDESLLWRKLAAKTLPAQWTAPGRAMPLDPVAPISTDELEALRLWIQYGAARTGVVPGTGELLDACLPPPQPIEIAPLPPPPAGQGVQIHMPRWVLPPRSEDEVCYASYYDVSDRVGPEFRDPTGKKFRVKGSRIRQDPLSHHLISFLYEGNSAPDDPIWGTYACRGGPRDGEPCRPTDLGACSEGNECGTEPVSRVACIGYGPPDASVGFESFGITGTQETAQEVTFPDGVYYEIPLKGIIMWNSHAFNLTDSAGKLEAWINFYFAAPESQRYAVDRIFDVSQIFKMNVPAFATQEVCAFYRFQPNAHLFEISTHMHQRGKRFRVFDGAFACDGGPNAGQPCSPFGADFASPDLCSGAPCRAPFTMHAGDCNKDGRVTINELVTAVRIAVGGVPPDECPYLDLDADRRAAIDEIVRAIDAALNGTAMVSERDPENSLLYVNFVYNDPVILQFEPPRVFWATLPPSERTFTYCALYDNGFTNPDTVKRRSTSPGRPGGIGGLFGGPCAVATHCTAGRVGAACAGETDAERDASCNSSAGAGDGFCDACPLRGGVTTEDEMFAFFGAYYVP